MVWVKREKYGVFKYGCKDKVCERIEKVTVRIERRVSSSKGKA